MSKTGVTAFMLAGKAHTTWFRWLVVSLLILACGTAATTQSRQQKSDSARAQELIRQAKIAAGFETADGGIQSLSFKAKTERFIKYFSVQSPTKVVENDKTLGGKVEVEFSLPDKFRVKTKSDTLSGFDISFTEALNGELAWRDPPMTVRSFGPDQRVIDVGDVERTMLMQTRTAKQRIAFYTLGWLLQTPPSVPVEMSYGGVVDVEDRKCDAVVVDGQEGLRNILLFDQKTHLLTGLGVVFFDVIRETVIVEVAGFDRRYIRDTYARARQERMARTKPGQQHEMLWHFLDQSSVGGVTLPHRVKITLDGRTIEEMAINEYKVNQPINPRRFEGKPEVKY